MLLLREKVILRLNRTQNLKPELLLLVVKVRQVQVIPEVAKQNPRYLLQVNKVADRHRLDQLRRREPKVHLRRRDQLSQEHSLLRLSDLLKRERKLLRLSARLKVELSQVLLDQL